MEKTVNLFKEKENCTPQKMLRRLLQSKLEKPRNLEIGKDLENNYWNDI